MAALGNMISAMVAQRVIEHLGPTGGPAGALVGPTLAMVTRRLGPLGMAGVAVGMWAVQEARRARTAQPTLVQPRR